MTAQRRKAKKSSIYIRRRRRERIILLVLVLVLAFIGFLIVKSAVSLPYETIDMCNLGIVSFDGYEGAGTAEVTVNDEAIDDLLTQVKQDYEDAAFHNTDPQNEDYLKFRQSISITLDKTSNLVNGSVVNMVCSYDKELAKLLKIEVASTTKQIVVSGLPDVMPVSVDELFENLEVSFSGVSPNLAISMHNQSEHPFIKRVNFEIIDPKEYYSSGEVVQIRASFSEELTQETRYFVNASEEECVRSFEATASSKYISGASELPSSILQEAINAGKSAFKDANEYGVRIFCEANLVPVYINKKATFVYGTPNLVSAYFKSVMPNKAGELGYNYNDLDIIYSVVISQADGVACTAYAAVRFSNIIENEDGSYEYDFSNPTILTESYYSARVKKNVSDSYVNNYIVEKVK